MFPRVQADLNHLPFASSSFDIAIFNASFHYSEDFAATLAEALRCVRPGSSIVIADTPWYRKERSGLDMVAEKHAHFLNAYGFASNSLRSQEFLTTERLHTLAHAFGLRWRVLKPWYGLHWALRPLRARLRGRRVPSKFHVFVAERAQ
jgi:SAM-dependent methyltransferase